MKTKTIIAAILIGFALIFTGCGDEDGDGGMNATPETIIGKWMLKTFRINGSIDMAIPAFMIDTTVAIDTSGNFPEGDYFDFKADGTYEQNVTLDLESMMAGSLGMGMKQSAAVAPEQGTWSINGGALVMIQGEDTTYASASINGSTITFSATQDFDESEQGVTMAGSMTFTFTGTK